MVERVLRAGYRLESLLIDGKRTKPLPAVVDEAVPLYACASQVLQRITGYHLHRGVLACFRRRELLDFATAVEDARTVAIIEGVNNPTNLGVILRCAVALGVDAYLLDPTCCDPLYRRCGRVSMGEAFGTPYTRLDSFPKGLDPVKAAGFEVLALTPAPDAVPLPEVRLGPDDRVALMLGAERPGLTEAAMAASHRRVQIPIAGVAHSINVGSAAAVGFYAVAEARRRSSDRG